MGIQKRTEKPTNRKKRAKLVFWLLVLIGFNYFVYLVQLKPLKDAAIQHTTIVATWGWQPQTGLEMKQIIIWDNNFLVELAKTKEQRRVWLMYRASMGEKEGMIFIFDQEQELSFWMDNTYIPLDLLYVWSDLIIKHIHTGAKTLDKSFLPSIYPVQYVIELNSGAVTQFDIKVGDVVKGI